MNLYALHNWSYLEIIYKVEAQRKTTIVLKPKRIVEVTDLHSSEKLVLFISWRVFL